MVGELAAEFCELRQVREDEASGVQCAERAGGGAVGAAVEQADHRFALALREAAVVEDLLRFGRHRNPEATSYPADPVASDPAKRGLFVSSSTDGLVESALTGGVAGVAGGYTRVRGESGLFVTTHRRSNQADRSETLVDRLRREWRETVKKQSPAAREQWLKSQDGISALGAKTCCDLLKQLNWNRRHVMQLVCGGAWLDGHQNGRDPDGKGDLQYPPPQPDPKIRKHAVRMVLSRARTSFGCHDPLAKDFCGREIPTRRWTPPQAVAREDQIDSMTMSFDRLYLISLLWEDSPSAQVINRIGALKAKPVGGNW
jgi:hypothetical protein